MALLSCRTMPGKRFFCYVDETGQDTQGRLFVVAVVVAQTDRSALIRQLEGIERQSGKGNVKWSHTRLTGRKGYVERLLGASAFKGTLNYAVYGNTRNYPAKTVLTVAQTIMVNGLDQRKAVVYVDGLRRSQYHWFGVELRHLGVRIDKVRGIPREQADALLRLADAVCGLVRAADSGLAPFPLLLDRAKREGFFTYCSQ